MTLERWPLGFDDSPSYAAPLIPFASFPAALTVEGQIRRPAELPHISLIALGGLWRPLGGRQVLALRGNNPVTVQDLTGIAADTMGPFPGGLVRAGMRLLVDWSFATPGISTGNRLARIRIGNGATRNSWVTGAASGSGTDNAGRFCGVLAIGSDVSANHVGGINSTIPFGVDFFSNTPSVDFSQPWAAETFGRSVAETATNITSVSWSGGVATFVNPSHTLNTGDKTTVAGVSVGGYNGVYSNITRIDANTWSGTLVANPGGAGTGGTSSRISNVISQSYSLTLEG